VTNPYQPPAEDDAASAAPSSADYVEASQGQRFANLVLDNIAFIIFSAVLGAALQLVGLGDLLQGVFGNFFGIITITVYYVVFEGIWGRTPAKLITGTRVVHVDGGPPRFMQIVGRTLTRFVPLEPFSFLGSGTGWHDRWSSTRVVRAR
jgi:uncharacterized RDD family membrane protein YckC